MPLKPRGKKAKQSKVPAAKKGAKDHPVEPDNAYVLSEFGNEYDLLSMKYYEGDRVKVTVFRNGAGGVRFELKHNEINAVMHFQMHKDGLKKQMVRFTKWLAEVTHSLNYIAGVYDSDNPHTAKDAEAVKKKYLTAKFNRKPTKEEDDE